MEITFHIFTTAGVGILVLGTVTPFSLVGEISWHIVVSTVTIPWIGQLRSLGLIPSRDKILLPSLKCPDWFWGPSSS